MVSLTHSVRSRQHDGTPEEIVKDYDIEFYNGEALTCKKEVRGNHRRFNSISLEKVSCDRIRVKPLSTWGASKNSIYEIRVY